MSRTSTTLVGLALVLGACNDAPPARYPAAAPVQEVEAELVAGDSLEIQVFWGNQESKSTYALGVSGTIMVRHIGEVVAAGKKPSALQREIRDRLADGYLRDPIVAIKVVPSTTRRVSVFGQVQQASTIAYTEGMTIVDAIAQAGGFAAMAKKNAVQVTRVVAGKKVTYTIGVEAIGEGRRPNFDIQPGDVVFVPERLF